MQRAVRYLVVPVPERRVGCCGSARSIHVAADEPRLSRPARGSKPTPRHRRRCTRGRERRCTSTSPRTSTTAGRTRRAPRGRPRRAAAPWGASTFVYCSFSLPRFRVDAEWTAWGRGATRATDIQAPHSRRKACCVFVSSSPREGGVARCPSSPLEQRCRGAGAAMSTFLYWPRSV